MNIERIREVPFFPNVNNRCGVATNQMILGYFEPDFHPSQAEMDDFTGQVEGMGAWSITTMLSFAKRGYDLVWIEDFDFHKFSNDALGYLREIFKDEEKIEYQLTHSDIPAEQARAQSYLNQGLPFENRTGTIKDIKRLLDEGYLVRLEVNGMPLAGKDGYCGHMVLAISYNDDNIIIHNPDGIYGSLPNQIVPNDLLLRSWREFGGSFALQAVRKK